MMRRLLVLVCATVLLVAGLSAQAQTREELQQARVEIRARLHAAQSELAELTRQLPSMLADEATLEQKEVYVDRILALRGDLEILQSDLDFLDFRLGDAATEPNAVDRESESIPVEGTIYKLVRVEDHEGSTTTQSGYRRSPNGSDSEVYSATMPREIVVGQTFSLTGVEVHTFDCLQLLRDAEAAQTRLLAVTGATATIGVNKRTWTAAEDKGCNRDSDTGKFSGGTQSNRARVAVSFSPDTSGSRPGRYRYAAEGVYEGIHSPGGDDDLLISGSRFEVFNGLRFFYEADVDDAPLVLEPVEVPDGATLLTGDGGQGSETDDAALSGTNADLADGATGGRDEEAGSGDVTGSDGSGGGGGASGGSAIDPNSPDIAALIDRWLGIAEPPQNATEGGSFRYNQWGQLRGTSADGGVAEPTGSPDEAAGRDPRTYVWSINTTLDSVDHCTLGEYVDTSLAGGSLAHCAGRHRPAAPGLAGLSHTAAVQRISRLKLQPVLKAGSPAATAAKSATVERQDPAPGVELARDGSITVWLHTPYVDKVTVPDLVGQRAGKAQEALSALGLVIRPIKGKAANDDAAVGTVAAQDPAAGSEVRRETTVSVRVYGPVEPARIAVGDYTGLAAAAAKQAVEQAGFIAVLEIGEAAPTEDQSGRVIRQSPAGGQALARGESVRLTLYGKAVNAVQVPDILGQAASEARQALVSSDLEPEFQVGEAAPTSRLSGTVKSVTPAPGSTVRRGSVVSAVVYANHVEAVLVPDVVGLSGADATRRLSSIGLKASGGWSTGKVLEQRPAAGARVREGGSVVLVMQEESPATRVNEAASGNGNAISGESASSLTRINCREGMEGLDARLSSKTEWAEVQNNQDISLFARCEFALNNANNNGAEIFIGWLMKTGKRGEQNFSHYCETGTREEESAPREVGSGASYRFYPRSWNIYTGSSQGKAARATIRTYHELDPNNWETLVTIANRYVNLARPFAASCDGESLDGSSDGTANTGGLLESLGIAPPAGAGYTGDASRGDKCGVDRVNRNPVYIIVNDRSKCSAPWGPYGGRAGNGRYYCAWCPPSTKWRSGTGCCVD